MFCKLKSNSDINVNENIHHLIKLNIVIKLHRSDQISCCNDITICKNIYCCDLDKAVA